MERLVFFSCLPLLIDCLFRIPYLWIEVIKSRFIIARRLIITNSEANKIMKEMNMNAAQQTKKRTTKRNNVYCSMSSIKMNMDLYPFFFFFFTLIGTFVYSEAICRIFFADRTHIFIKNANIDPTSILYIKYVPWICSIKKLFLLIWYTISFKTNIYIYTCLYHSK